MSKSKNVSKNKGKATPSHCFVYWVESNQFSITSADFVADKDMLTNASKIGLVQHVPDDGATTKPKRGWSWHRARVLACADDAETLENQRESLLLEVEAEKLTAASSSEGGPLKAKAIQRNKRLIEKLKHDRLSKPAADPTDSEPSSAACPPDMADVIPIPDTREEFSPQSDNGRRQMETAFHETNADLSILQQELQQARKRVSELEAGMQGAQEEIKRLRAYNYHLQDELPSLLKNWASSWNNSTKPTVVADMPADVIPLSSMEDLKKLLSNQMEGGDKIGSAASYDALFDTLQIKELVADAIEARTCFVSAKSYKQLTGALMDRVLSESELTTCSARGKKSAKPPLSNTKVNAIVEAVLARFPDSKEAEIIDKMNIKLRDAATKSNKQL